MRLYPPVVLAVSLAAMAALDRWAPLARLWERWAWAGALLAIAGLGLVVWAALTMRRHGTTLHPHAQASALVTSGPFAISRHPIYLGFAMILAGFAAALGGASPFAVLPAFAIVMERRFMIPEERRLAAAFGAPYAAYAHTVRRWF